MEVDVEFDVTADHNITIGVAYESDHLHLNATDATSVSINVVALFFLISFGLINACIVICKRTQC
ncbi:MAG: hypothetical protein IKO61_03015 [Lachnospiraceae bacterium]|nr:hypothetical protein [Lachnospiraceae bacterium]